MDAITVIEDRTEAFRSMTKEFGLASGKIMDEFGGEVTGGADLVDSMKVSNGPIAQRYNLDFEKYEKGANLPTGYLERMAQIESSGNSGARNSKSSAGGLFQQIDANWEAYGPAGGDRFNPEDSTVAAVAFAVENANRLRNVLGREPEGWELYLAHQQGGGGATKLLKNPDAKVSTLLSRDAIVNNGGNMNMTAGEFANIWKEKFNKPGGTRATQGVGEVTSGPIPEDVAGDAMTAITGADDTGAPTSSPTPESRPDASVIPPEMQRLFEEGGSGFTGEKNKFLDESIRTLSASQVEGIIRALVAG
jgi:hypothetical protein